MKKYNVLKYLSIFTIIVFIISFSMVYQLSHIFAHSFTTDDTSYFIGLDKRTKVELELAYKNYPSNITLTMDHTDNAARLVYDIYYADDDVVDYNDFITRYDQALDSTNSTTYALVVADLLDEVLRNYADAIVSEIDLTNMSNLVLLDNKESLTDSSVTSENDSSNVNFTKFFSKNNPIFNPADYETAKALVVEVKDVFENHLKSSSSTATKQSIDVISNLEKDFEKSEDEINNNSSPAELMELVHLQIHSSLQTGFGLQTKMAMDDGQMNMDSGQMNMDE